MPPLNALRAFEAAARHLSLTRAAEELHVTAGALSHQIRGLEDLLGLKLFERHVRSIALTSAGKQLYPGLQTAFVHIRDAVAGLSNAADDRVLVISTPPGLTAKWLAPRLYRFSAAHPEIDVRISSSLGIANFTTDGVDVALRTRHAMLRDIEADLITLAAGVFALGKHLIHLRTNPSTHRSTLVQSLFVSASVERGSHHKDRLGTDQGDGGAGRIERGGLLARKALRALRRCLVWSATGGTAGGLR